jgi:hypothetical protein
LGWIDSLVGVLNLELDGASVVERRMEPSLVVDLVDEVRKAWTTSVKVS